MAYIDENDLVDAAGDLNRLNQMVDNRAAPAGVADARQYWIDRAIAKGEAKVNTYLAPTFETPLANPSEEIKDIAAAEAIYFLIRTQGGATADELEAHKERVTELEAMRDSKAAPGDPLPKTTRQPRGQYITNETAMSRAKMKGFL